MMRCVLFWGSSVVSLRMCHEMHHKKGLLVLPLTNQGTLGKIINSLIYNHGQKIIFNRVPNNLLLIILVRGSPEKYIIYKIEYIYYVIRVYIICYM